MVLDKFVSFGQDVPCGLEVERTYRPKNADQEFISVLIVQSTDLTVDSVLDHSVTPLATLRAQVPLHLPFEERLVSVRMKFGATEIITSAAISDTEVTSHLDFNTNETMMPASTALFTENKSVHFLIDVSSSMADQAQPGRIKLDDAKTGIKYVMDTILQNGKDSVALSSFNNDFHEVLREDAVGQQHLVGAVDALSASGGTHFYEACVRQLQVICALPRDKKRFLLVFTDGVDNSCHSFESSPHFMQLNSLLRETGGVCDSHLTRFFVIAVGLRESGLKPLRKLTESGKLTLMSFEKATDIQSAFVVASEEIEKVIGAHPRCDKGSAM